jgi:hypothetical protein
MHCFVMQLLQDPPLCIAARLKLSRMGPHCNYLWFDPLMDTSSACSMDGIVQEPVYFIHAKITQSMTWASEWLIGLEMFQSKCAPASSFSPGWGSERWPSDSV